MKKAPRRRLALVFLLFAGPAFGQDIRVVDGDTIAIEGEPNARLVGFNAPETFRYQCETERRLGKMAAERLEALITQGVQLTRVPCACRPGTEGTRLCNYGRQCVVMTSYGRNVGDILIEEGLAVPFVCRGTRCPPTPKPWCR